jgi:fumarate reductase flavoprotein subunit
MAAETDMQKADGIADRWQDLADYWILKGEGRINEPMVRSIAENSARTVTWFQANGVEFMEHLQTPTSEPWANPRRTHKAGNGAGTGFTVPLTASAEKKGVTVLVNTPVTGLLVENGVVVGVQGKTATGGSLTVRAKKVILATGGYENNPELAQQYSPLITVTSPVGEAHNGDGLLWARELGSPIIAGNGGIVLAINYFLIGASGDYDPYGLYLYVDPSGKRFMNEAAYWFGRSRKVLDFPGQHYYAVLDSKALANGIGIEAGVEAGGAFKADTLDALADQMGVDAAVLKATVDRYNQAAAAKQDAEFGKDPAKLTAIDQAPFYATICTFNSNSGSFGGPQINNDCQVLGANGQPIPGLYAVGEVANGEIFYREYPVSGSAIQSYSSMGRIAGAHAAGSL